MNEPGNDNGNATSLESPDEAVAESPCIGVCELDELGLCRGCFRMLDEIASWAGFDAQQRATVLARVARRRAAHSPDNRPDIWPD